MTLSAQRESGVNGPAEGRRTSLWLVNTFELRHDEDVVHVAAPAQRVLAFLALRRRGVPRRMLASTLWTELDEQAAAARLRSALWRLPSPAGEKLVRSVGGRMRLAPHLKVDIHVAEDDDGVDALQPSQLIGDVLADWDEWWVDVERERFRQLQLHRLEQLSDRARAHQQYGLALQSALAAVAVEPLRESAHRRVMQVHLAEDNPAEALRQFELVRRVLRDELGLAPSPATRSLVAPLLGRPLDSAPDDVDHLAG